MIDLTLLTLPFFQRALIVGLLLSLLMSLLGVIVILRRLSFFADAIGHAALTGIALGLLLQVNPFLSALIYAVLVAFGLAAVQRRSRLPLDSLLGVFFAASVALGVILVQRTPGYQSNLLAFLFGDILTVSRLDVVLTIIITAVALAALARLGKPFISLAFNPSLAKAEGVPVATLERTLLLLLAALVALSIKIVGVILVTALLVIPAATAHNLATSLSRLFTLSALLGPLTVISGMLLSATLNTAPGPTIILTGSSLFALSLIIKPLLRQ